MKYLGVLIDENLNWDKHIAKVRQKCFFKSCLDSPYWALSSLIHQKVLVQCTCVTPPGLLLYCLELLQQNPLNSIAKSREPGCKNSIEQATTDTQ